MAQANPAYITSKFHNLSNEALAGAIGQADAVLKGAEVECKLAARALGQTAVHKMPVV